MAKTGRRARQADIAQVGALIFRRADAEQEAADAPAEGSTGAATDSGTDAPGRAPARVPGGQLAQHPATAERMDRRTRRDVFDLNPRRIIERGPYIREWDAQGEAFERLVEAVRERGEVDTPIWVRSHGPTGQREFVLVAGKGRLRAALQTGLATVPIRDLGEIDDQQAVGRQVEENLNREDMTPAETAHALWRLHGFGESISAIGRRLHRDKGYVSYMVRVGEAFDALTPEEQAGLARRGALQVRQCQAIGAVADVDARAAALREVLHGGTAEAAGVRGAGAGDDAADIPDLGSGATSGAARPDSGSPARSGARPRADEQTPFYGRAIRNGRTFRMRWVEQELRADPGAVVDGFVRAMQAERAYLVEALRRLEADRGAGEARNALVQARRALERAARR